MSFTRAFFHSAKVYQLALALIFLSLILMSSSCGGDEPDPGGAEDGVDMVLRNGVIYTVNEAQPLAEAVAIDEGLIVFVGSNTEVEQYIGSNTTVEDLNGRMVMPGIHDVHIHPLEAASESITFQLSSSETNPENFATAIANAHAANPGSGWLIGSGHSIFTLLDATRPVKEIINEVVSNRPVIILEETSHSAFVNSMALELAGFTRTSPDPVGGIIMKDLQTGEPNGILIDNAGNIVMDLAQAPSSQTRMSDYDGLTQYMLPELAKHGITSISDARSYWKRDHHLVWKQVEDDNQLTVRVNLGLWAYPDADDNTQIPALQALYSNDASKLLKINQVKFYVDGITINTTAALKSDYLIDLFERPSNNGLNYFTESRLASYLAALEPVGFDFNIHAIGNRGITEALNAIAQGGSSTGRHRLTHIEIMSPSDYPRFAQLNVTADTQVAGEFTNPSNWAENAEFIGQENSQNIIPLKSLSEAGARITLSSDHDVSTLNPFVAMQHAVTRAPQELSLAETIKAYTINSAYVMRQENQVGSIEVGKEADLIVLDQNILDISPTRIAQTKVDLTILLGEVIYRR